MERCVEKRRFAKIDYQIIIYSARYGYDTQDTDNLSRRVNSSFLSNRSTNRIFNVINDVLLFDQEA